MEFNEKLQQLRIGKNLTQQQLAEQLYVSRTAISKWESGKGYPNIESLKCISRFFSITIDELLSSEELITLAEAENHSNVNRIHNIISGIIDVLAIALIVLPIYGEPQGSHFLSCKSSVNHSFIKYRYWNILGYLFTHNWVWNCQTCFYLFG